MRKYTMALVLACILTLGLGGAVSAFEPNIPTPFPPPQWWEDGSGEFVWVYYADDVPFDWGPAVYYGQPVIVNYILEGRDFSISKNSYYSLQLHGTVKVYEALSETEPGALLDERLYKGKITFRDSKNTDGWPPRGWPMGYSMYQYEQFNMNWTIPGVYRSDITCKNGHWTIAFVVHTAPPVRGGMFPDEPPFEFDAPIP